MVLDFNLLEFRVQRQNLLGCRLTLTVTSHCLNQEHIIDLRQIQQVSKTQTHTITAPKHFEVVTSSLSAILYIYCSLIGASRRQTKKQMNKPAKITGAKV